MRGSSSSGLEDNRPAADVPQQNLYRHEFSGIWRELSQNRLEVDHEMNVDRDDTSRSLGAVSIDGRVNPAAQARISPLDAVVLQTVVGGRTVYRQA